MIATHRFDLMPQGNAREFLLSTQYFTVQRTKICTDFKASFWPPRNKGVAKAATLDGNGDMFSNKQTYPRFYTRNDLRGLRFGALEVALFFSTSGGSTGSDVTIPNRCFASR